MIGGVGVRLARSQETGEEFVGEVVLGEIDGFHGIRRSLFKEISKAESIFLWTWTEALLNCSRFRLCRLFWRVAFLPLSSSMEETFRECDFLWHDLYLLLLFLLLDSSDTEGDGLSLEGFRLLGRLAE